MSSPNNCPQCGKTVQPSSKFCSFCGEDLLRTGSGRHIVAREIIIAVTSSVLSFIIIGIISLIRPESVIGALGGATKTEIDELKTQVSLITPSGSALLTDLATKAEVADLRKRIDAIPPISSSGPKDAATEAEVAELRNRLASIPTDAATKAEIAELQRQIPVIPSDIATKAEITDLDSRIAVVERKTVYIMESNGDSATRIRAGSYTFVMNPDGNFTLHDLAGNQLWTSGSRQ